MSEDYNYSDENSEEDQANYKSDESVQADKEYEKVADQVDEVENIFQCTICEKFFSNDMLCNDDKNLKCCLHCHFWMNYDTFKKMAPSKFSDDEIKPNAKDDTEILVIKDICDYILHCSPDHDSTVCPRKNDSCFMCDYKEGLFTLDIPKISPVKPKIKKSIQKFNYNANGMQLKIPKQFSI